MTNKAKAAIKCLHFFGSLDKVRGKTNCKNKDEWIKRNKMAISKMFIQLKRRMAVVVRIKRRPQLDEANDATMLACLWLSR